MPSYSIDEVLEALAASRLTVLVVSSIGEVVALEAHPMDLPSEQLIDDVMHRYRGCSVSFLPQASYTRARVAEIISESVEAIALNRAGALRPGANIVRPNEE
jgi:hypothetical protein